MPFFKDTTLLITHYNRSNSLERLLKRFKELELNFEEVVVSDDGSKPEHLDRLKEMEGQYGYRLVTAPKNKGLANNLNKGQAAVKTPLTLYVQEDFDPRPIFVEKLANAVQFITERTEIDMVRFYAYWKYPFLKPYKNGFSEMDFSVMKPGYRKFYVYSDHPHLRRSDFNKKFGNYREGVHILKSEYEMMISFLQKKGKALYYDDFKGLFDQKNSSDEPSTWTAVPWRQSENPLIAGVRSVYRFSKFTFDYFFQKPQV